MAESTPLPQTLDAWLAHIERMHPQAIDMGLNRVRAVKDAMALRPACPVFTVGGTNGKGSACMMLEAMLHHAGYKVGCYTSPHLLVYNERVRIAGANALDGDLVRAFEAVQAARSRAGVTLTYFEFGTLAALWLFLERKVDVMVLEIGLGGRLDAVNAFEPDCAMVMSVAMDHMNYLGDTREKIGFEKAHIYRAGKPAIYAADDPPRTLLDHAAAIGAPLLLRGRDYDFKPAATQWSYQGPGGARHGLPYPALRGAYQLANAAACITALDSLRARCPVTMNDARTGLLCAQNPGRFQVLPGQPTIILDVAHNPHAAQALAGSLKSLPRGGRTLAVFAMLSDKDIAGVIEIVKPRIDHWFAAGIGAPRGASGDTIAQFLSAAGIASVTRCDDVAAALNAARGGARVDDKIVVFGSFYTVSEAMQVLKRLT
ncbi:MAG: bifunctional tetrahydrofolate synthase/dihydrofolate synthase [Betaproteobacteria bacterium]|nr:bifunctional tetrahydrofolate synthase/dihydrofolate synthase [Betaproteobacteria bacterium]